MIQMIRTDVITNRWTTYLKVGRGDSQICLIIIFTYISHKAEVYIWKCIYIYNYFIISGNLDCGATARVGPWNTQLFNISFRNYSKWNKWTCLLYQEPIFLNFKNAKLECHRGNIYHVILLKLSDLINEKARLWNYATINSLWFMRSLIDLYFHICA